ncbi:RagB/SusD family nutrient uptake outer membrane protein [Pedobacter petrophilus]|uniref:RagB/SusD family nutrient uptake outer membrane protein n=1 Tax=Pedobacter petrophilus TaxID=1908241 RepID=A0A7K0FZ42_9SPHI|nr:RagB/SusD family nutrient uptake outer membrane protein [Pedobacter petrophilus]MRX76470.1 RagB/SusD family nutrient uptake outer membrane protein [Pedobacter petrophilus]
MKKIISKIKFTGSLLGLLAIASCTKELNQEPITSKSLGSFLTTETEVEEYINAVYGTLQTNGLYGLYLPAIGEIPSDNTFDEVPANDGGMYGQLDQFTTVASNGMLSDFWKNSYQGIQRANTVLNRVDGIAYAVPAIKQARKGEMHFIRALLYFNLVRVFGDVPLVTKETTNPNEFFGQGRTSKDLVYAQVITDLNSAVQELPVSTGTPGKAIKTAAQSLLGKVYLTLGKFAESRAVLADVVASGKHQLLNDPADIFSVSNKNNSEIIFAVQFASGLNGNSEGSSAYQQFSPSGSISGAKGHNLPTKSFYQLYSAGDKRKSAYVGITAAGTPFSTKLKASATTPVDGGSNFVVLRYADVLLMLAETENELGNQENAIKSLNLVRRRAGLTDAALQNQTELRAAILAERRLELIGEGDRWFDLLRTNTAVPVMNGWFASQNITTRITTRDLLQPIPQDQIDTDPSIKQNL